MPSLAIPERQSTKICVYSRSLSVPHDPDQSDCVMMQCDGECTKQMGRRLCADSSPQYVTPNIKSNLASSGN